MNDEMIWRYLDFPRFISMLSTSCLWFAKAATFSDDPWEGFGRAKTLPLEVDDLPKVLRQEAPGGTRTDHSVSQMLALWSQAAAGYVENAAEHLYINSWFAGTTESMALWEIYGSQGRGVALQSTTERYRKSAQFELPPEQYLFGRVTYHDDVEIAPELLQDFTQTISLPGSDLWPKVLGLALHKRSCYRHENEWRAVIYQDPRPDIRGIVEPFDVTQLIHQIVVGPRAEEFSVNAVVAITEKFSPQLSVRRSTLLHRPIKGLP
jgi:hypothetical protein